MVAAFVAKSLGTSVFGRIAVHLRSLEIPLLRGVPVGLTEAPIFELLVVGVRTVTSGFELTVVAVARKEIAVS